MVCTFSEHDVQDEDVCPSSLPGVNSTDTSRGNWLRGRVALLPCHSVHQTFLRFDALMAQDNLALVVLRTTLSPALKAESRVFSSSYTSAFIQGFCFFPHGDGLGESNLINALGDEASH